MRAALLPLLALAACGLDYGINEKDNTPLDSGGDPAPDITVEPLNVDFGRFPVAEGQLSEVVYIANSGDANLELQGLALAEPDGPFTITAADATLLPPALSTRFVVTLDSAVEGAVSGQVRIDSNDPDEPTVLVNLSGEGVPIEDTGPIDTGVVEETGDCECPEGFEPRPADDGCERESTVPATQIGEPGEICAIDPYFAYGMFGARYPDGLSVQDSYWGQNDSVNNGRLNASGVWACEGSTGQAGSNPVREWIGVAVCLEVDEPGDYLVGLGADNRFRMSLDGALAFEKDEYHTRVFNYWWMQPLSLPSGKHVLELEGYNDGSIAGFAAEIAGPFPAGSLVDDASMSAVDYANSLVFTTASLPGSRFVLGENSGWTCPDGSTYDACAEEPECVVLESAACLE